MGKVALAAKVTHVPSMYISEHPGPHQGCRQAAIDGHRELARRAEERGVDTFVVFDVHWLVNAGYHVNSSERFKGVYTSHELPHFIQDMPYDYRGNPELGDAIADAATVAGVKTRSHRVESLTLEYGTLVPMRYMNGDGRFRVVSIAAWCEWHSLADSLAFGAAVRRAIEASGSTAAVLASGSLSHRFNDNGSPEESMFQISREIYRQMDEHVVGLWKARRYREFLAMLPEYAEKAHGEGKMHDTAMLFGLLGGESYDGECEIVTDYFPSSGTGQINAEFHMR